MPEITGLDLYSMVHADNRFQHLPFILCTGFADEPTVREALRLGIRHFIVKPITSKVVLEKLRVIEAESPPSAEPHDSGVPRPRLTDPDQTDVAARATDRIADPGLAIPLDAARECIETQIATGTALLDIEVRSLTDLTRARVARRAWSLQNHVVLGRVFDNHSVAAAYGETMLDTVSMRTDMFGKIAEYHSEMRRSIDKLRAIAGMLDRLSADPHDWQ